LRRYQADAVQAEVEKADIKNTAFVLQEEQLGTGHAVACSQETWNRENILILYGDMPLVTKELIENLIQEHQETNATITFLTAMVMDPSGYGRVIERDGKFTIIEQKDATPEQCSINRINAGIYVMKRAFLEESIKKIGTSSISGEIYLVDLIKMACDQEQIVHAIQVPYDNVRGVNTLQDLWGVEQIKRSDFIKHWMANGVRFELAQSIHIDINVTIGAGSFIGTGVHLLGDTTIGEECFVGAFSIVSNSTVNDSSTIHSHSVVQNSKIGSNVHVGPFARLHEHVVVGDNAHVGNFVEVKRSIIGAKSRAKHLSYLGDAQLGDAVNIGAGTITCNYDGVQKNATIIEEGAFVGSNNTLVAPIKIGKGAYTAAGSTLTEDVPENALAIGRSKQTNKLDYAKKIRARRIAHREKVTVEKMTIEESGESQQGKAGATFNFKGAVKTEPTHHNEN
jgi:bifunctional UDP-N-acetylglucosamine pyrophosphorylase/glucosamine-1-phosphate N-acetyltransferase